MKKIIVTRHQALIDVLIEDGLVPAGTPVVSHATPDAIRGMHVYGVLPPSLAVLADCVTEIPLNIPAELRGVELTTVQVRALMGAPWTYRVSFA